MIRDLLERYPDPAQFAFALRNRADLCRSGETVEALIDHAAEIRGWNLARCRGLAELAVELARKIEGPQGVALKARALAELGNAYRLSERLEEAREVFAEAETLLEEPLPAGTLAEVYLRLGAQYRDEDARPQAIAAVKAATALFVQVGDLCEETRALALLGQLLTATKRFAEAHRHLIIVIERLLRDTWDPDLLVSACLNVAYLYTEWAKKAPPARREMRLNAALTTLKSIRPLLDEHAHDRRSMEFDWIFGRLLQARGQYEEACTALEGLAERYHSAGYPRTAAMVALDLAECLVELKRLVEARTLAARCAQLFREADLPQDVIRGLKIIALADTIRAARKGLAMTRPFRDLASISDS